MIHSVYTDGSSISQGAGWACLVDGVMSSGSFPVATNNQMELMAVLMALDFIPSGDTAVFFTDSKLTVGWLMKGWNCSNQITADVIEAIGEVARAKRIQMHFHRVKGHSDSHQNNMVDFEAGRQAKLANASF